MEDREIIMEANYIMAGAKVLLSIAVVSAVADIVEHFHEGGWWPISYVASLSVPTVLVLLFVCVAFTPRRVRYSQNSFSIKRLLGGESTFRWEDLETYGYGRGVFLIRFEGASTNQIFAGAFRKKEWTAFVEFLRTNWPDKYATRWSGSISLR